MRDELLPYYQRELTFIRQMAAEFQAKYPSVAPDINLGQDKCEDPHVERMIEAFALLTGRIQHKIDDEFPEITESLLDVLYPHYLRPIPSQAIVQFALDSAQSAVPNATVIPSGSPVHSKPENGQVCSFQTCYDVKLWPLRVTAASISSVNRFTSPGISAEVAATLRIEMECLGGLTLPKLGIDSLRFFLRGETASVQALYETLFVNTLRIVLQSAVPGKGNATAVLSPSSLAQVGFTAEEGALDYSDHSFLGYRLLQEYFTFPEKFLFFDLTGLNRVSLSEFGNKFEIVIPLKEFKDKNRLAGLEQTVDASTFQLGCTPIINLFDTTAEPVRVSQTKTEYRIVPDQHRPLHTEVYSVNSVSSSAPNSQEEKVFQPFYSLRHSHLENAKCLWLTHRRPSFRKGDDNGTEVYLSLVDLNFKPSLPPSEMLTVRITCTNRDQASQERLRLSDDFGDLQVEGSALVRTRCLRKPTRSIRPPLRKSLQWRLISHLSLNHLSIVEKGRDALREMLRLYNFDDNPSLSKQIAGILNVESKASVSRVVSKTGITFCRGTDVTLTFDESEYAGFSVFLLASVLQRFLGLYSAVNSFTRVTAKNSKGDLKQWPPLAGEQILL
jgi:type VI secretion system protein ImpG